VPYVQNKLVALSALEQTLDNLWVYTGSLTDLNSLNRYFEKVRRELGPIKGVIHSACIYSDPDAPSFVTKDLDRMRKVWEPKINGLENLHTIFESDALTFFVSFSSVTGLIPHMARGASDYAMANAFVDFFSAYQQQNSRVQFKSIVWSDWNQTGAFTRISDKKMALVEDNFYQMGMRTFSIAEGCQLFEQAMACTHDSQVFIGFLDRSRFEQNRLSMLCPTTIQGATLAAQESAGQHAEVAVPAQDKGILYYLDQWEAEKRAGLEVPALRIIETISLDQIKQLEPELIHRIYKLLFAGSIQQTAQQESVDLLRLITQTLIEVLKLKTVDATQSFQNYGLDSISAMVFATRLEKKLKQQVKPQWLIEYATVESLSRHLMSQSSKYLLD
jgi:acyl carrier protein